MKKALSILLVSLLASVGFAQSFQIKEQSGNWLVYEKYDSFSGTRERYFLTKPNKDGIQFALLRASFCENSLYLYKPGGSFSNSSEIAVRFKATAKYREIVKSGSFRFFNGNPELVLLRDCAVGGSAEGNSLGIDRRQQTCKWNKVLVKVTGANGESMVTEIDISQMANMLMKYNIVSGQRYANSADCSKY